MEKHLSIPIGIIIEKCAMDGPWQTDVWRPTEAVVGQVPLETGSRIRRAGKIEAYFAGNAALDLYPSDIASYRNNLHQEIPRIYVVLAATDGRPPNVHLVTAAPDEAEAYLDGDPSLVDGVPMPPSLIALISTYIDEYDVRAAAEDEISGRRFRRAKDVRPESRQENSQERAYERR